MQKLGVGNFTPTSHKKDWFSSLQQKYSIEEEEEEEFISPQIPNFCCRPPSQNTNCNLGLVAED